MQSRKLALMILTLVVLAFGVSTTFAVSSASFMFDFTDDGDLADGPNYDIFGVDPIDDGECSGGGDAVVMIMVDATGGLTDIDELCLDLVDGSGGSDGDYGSIGGGYVPVSSPVTYALFDLSAADIAAISATVDSDQEYFDYVVANAVCLDEQFLDETDLGIPSADPYSLCGSGTLSTDGSCNLSIPSGSVVGEAPLGAQIYYAPGQATNLTLNPGTYVVVGQDETETYYKIVLACAFRWVRKDSMQPSYQAPQNGQALPTRIVS